MKSGKPSRTAIAAAAARAAHLHLGASACIHIDDYAQQLIGITDSKQLLEGLRQWNTPSVARVCAYFALRHRFAEDQLQRALDRGVRQIILLGAGLDSLALRKPALAKEVRLVEVDHPDSQRWKLARLDALGLATPSVIYVAVDFASESLETQLFEAGVGLDQPTYFSWLGVSQYINETACDATLRLIVGCPAGSEVVFDFIVRNDLLSPDERAFTDAACSASTVRGEPWLSYFDPIELEEHLASLGFSKVQRLTPPVAAARYYVEQPSDVTPLEAWQLVSAIV